MAQAAAKTASWMSHQNDVPTGGEKQNSGSRPTVDPLPSTGIHEIRTTNTAPASAETMTGIQSAPEPMGQQSSAAEPTQQQQQLMNSDTKSDWLKLSVGPKVMIKNANVVEPVESNIILTRYECEKLSPEVTNVAAGALSTNMSGLQPGSAGSSALCRQLNVKYKRRTTDTSNSLFPALIENDPQEPPAASAAISAGLRRRGRSDGAQSARQSMSTVTNEDLNIVLDVADVNRTKYLLKGLVVLMSLAGSFVVAVLLVIGNMNTPPALTSPASVTQQVPSHAANGSDLGTVLSWLFFYPE